ncbi:MAG: hypothetical protein KKA73_17815 [Chloroflexi bacterium]|nr:hypothetical protein [Chloroflexota bacterium]
MSQPTHLPTYQPYKAKHILNRHKRPDSWFWTAYSAHPYIGCPHACHFCYCREDKYARGQPAAEFGQVIRVKENAPELLDRELARVPVDVVAVGDWSATEHRFRLSRRMLEVILARGFPASILERSPFVLRDLDLVQAIHQKARAVVFFSITTTPESPQYDAVCRAEHHAPTPASRFKAMERFARAGIPTGTCMMPVLPGLGDDAASLESVVRWTREHGGSFVLVAGLTLSGQQRTYWLDYVARAHPALLPLVDRLYPTGKSYGPVGNYWSALARRVAEYGQKYGIPDRMPRPIIPGDARTVNKRLAEYLADEVYRMELRGEPSHRVWAYRKASWALEDLEPDVRVVYETMGRKGLESIKDVGPRLGQIIEGWLTTNAVKVPA